MILAEKLLAAAMIAAALVCAVLAVKWKEEQSKECFAICMQDFDSKFICNERCK
jgi:hypothetical protein